MQETQVPPLGQEDPLEKGMATYSSILAWERKRKTKPKKKLGNSKDRRRSSDQTKQRKRSEKPRTVFFEKIKARRL